MANKPLFMMLIWAILGCWISIGSAATVTDQEQSISLEAISEPAKPLTDDEISGFGCIIGSLGMFAAGYLAGPSEAIMLWGGGLLTPSNSGVLAVSILGGLGFAGCSIGATLAPTFTWAYERSGIQNAVMGTQ
jgi:hypothetical protein